MRSPSVFQRQYLAALEAGVQRMLVWVLVWTLPEFLLLVVLLRLFARPEPKLVLISLVLGLGILPEDRFQVER